MKIVNIALTVLILLFIFFIIKGVQGPIRFDNEKDRRSEKVIERLVDIRKGQIAYKSMNGHYAGEFKDLLSFLDTAEYAVVKMIGNADDSTAVIIRDTTLIAIKDSLFPPKFVIDSLQYIPYGGSSTFELSAGTIRKGNVDVQVFEAAAHYDKFMQNFNDQLLTNLIAKREDLTRYPGLKVGSMTEPSNAGNWE